MFKKIYIIEAKLSPEKIQRITEILDSKPEEFKRVNSCTHADYIVTELKSPSRIMRNVKKSTCPVVHISWLLESIRLDKQLDPQDYMIDVSELRKKEAIELSTRISARSLPRQCTWDQLAKMRLGQRFSADNSYCTMSAAALERARFHRSYGSKYKSTKSRTPSTCPSPTIATKSLSAAEFNTLEKETNFATLSTSSPSPIKERYIINPPSPRGSRSSPTALGNLEKEVCIAAHTSTLLPSKEIIPSLILPSMKEKYSSASPRNHTPSTGRSSSKDCSRSPTALGNLERETRLATLSACLSGRRVGSPLNKEVHSAALSSSSSGNRTGPSVTKKIITPTTDNEKKQSAEYSAPPNPADIIVIEDDNNDEVTAVNNSSIAKTAALDPVNTDNDTSFSITIKESSSCTINAHPSNSDIATTTTNQSTHTTTNQSTHTTTNQSTPTTTTATGDDISCSIEEITRSFNTSSSVDDAQPAAAASLTQSCSSSSVEFDPQQFSIFEILSL